LRAGSGERRAELGQQVQFISGLGNLDRFQGSLAGLDALVDIADGDQCEADAGQPSSGLLSADSQTSPRQVADVLVDAGFVG
jgi:hypothetical protein